jgi:hypothetical protein
MKHLFRFSIGLLAVMLVTGRAFAVSQPVITGQVSGIELCLQVVCGSAMFTGTVQLQVDGQAGKGSFGVSVEHDSPVPVNQGESGLIRDGRWFISTRTSVFRGTVTGGTITRNAGNTFTVTAALELEQGGRGTLDFIGILSHEDIPFTIVGQIVQSAR